MDAPCSEALRRLALDDDEFVRGFDTVIAAGVIHAGGGVVCRAGCTECCIGPFEITSLDAERLRRGVRRLEEADPAAASAMIRRARRQWGELSRVFPGDPRCGRLSEDEGARVAFFSRFESMACPALDKVDGGCLLYPFRPLSCRSFGVPIICGRAFLPPCRLNFVGAPPGVVQAAAVDPDPHDREAALTARLEEITGHRGDTIVAATLARLG